MREKIIIGNWKMNNNPKESLNFLNNFISKKIDHLIKVKYVIAPPFISIPYMLDLNGQQTIPLAVQNFYFKDNGAYTGEISSQMIKSLDIKYAIIGHSERREYFKETNNIVNMKVKKAISMSITPILAFGETLEQFNDNKTKDVIKNQLTECLKDIKLKDAREIIFAYEPIWAIGTGKTATSQQAEEICKYSRELIGDIYSKELCDNVTIIYGGSVNEGNINDLISKENIDGALVGGASLDVNKFIKIITLNDWKENN